MDNEEPKSTMSVDALVEQMKTTASGLEHSSVYFALREYGARHIMPKTVNFVKALIAIDRNGLVITTALASTISNRGMQGTLTALHALGDKGIILLTKESVGRGANAWIINPAFKNILKV